MGKKGQDLQLVKDRSIFVSGLPYTATEEEIRNLFSECGQIESIKLPKFQDSGRLIGYGHIVFIQVKSAQAALKKDKTTVGQRYITVQMAKGEQNNKRQSTESPPDDCKSIFVKNLPYEITSDEIGDEFRHCGPIENVRMVYNTATNRFKGFCYIDFKQPDAVKVAMKMNGNLVMNRPIYIDFEVGKPKQGFHYNVESMKESKYNKDVKEVIKKKIKKDKIKQKVSQIKNFAKVQKEELQQQRQQKNFE